MECGKVFASQTRDKVFNAKSVDQSVEAFHNILTENLNSFLPEKTVKISTFDKKWFSPSLRRLHRQKQREFFLHRYSDKFKRLNKAFRKLKKRSIRDYYVTLTDKLKSSNLCNYFKVVKQICGYEGRNCEREVEELAGLSEQASVERIAEHFAAVSGSYEPVQLAALPAYLPAPPPPQVTEMQVYTKIRKLKNIQSTYPIDLPYQLRREYDLFLVTPLRYIFNECLETGVFPEKWKLEIVTPIAKISEPKQISDLRKIAGTSDYSKLLESFLKDWILEDIKYNIDPSQFGGRKGSGTEHLVVCFVDRVLKLLDSTILKSAVILAACDWSAAFDRLDPTYTYTYILIYFSQTNTIHVVTNA